MTHTTEKDAPHDVACTRRENGEYVCSPACPGPHGGARCGYHADSLDDLARSLIAGVGTPIPPGECDCDYWHDKHRSHCAVNYPARPIPPASSALTPEDA